MGGSLSRRDFVPVPALRLFDCENLIVDFDQVLGLDLRPESEPLRLSVGLEGIRHEARMSSGESGRASTEGAQMGIATDCDLALDRLCELLAVAPARP